MEKMGAPARSPQIHPPSIGAPVMSSECAEPICDDRFKIRGGEPRTLVDHGIVISA